MTEIFSASDIHGPDPSAPLGDGGDQVKRAEVGPAALCQVRTGPSEQIGAGGVVGPEPDANGPVAFDGRRPQLFPRAVPRAGAASFFQKRCHGAHDRGPLRWRRAKSASRGRGCFLKKTLLLEETDDDQE